MYLFFFQKVNGADNRRFPLLLSAPYALDNLIKKILFIPDRGSYHFNSGR